MAKKAAVFIGPGVQRVLTSSEQAFDFYQRQFAKFLGVPLRQFQAQQLGPTARYTFSLVNPKKTDDLRAVADGFDELASIVSSPARMNKILKLAYQRSVSEYLQRHWPKRLPSHSKTASSDQKPWNLAGARTGTDTLNAQNRIIWEGFMTSIKVKGMHVGLPSLRAYATREAINLSSPSDSAYTSTFMILEFGTGAKAKPQPRPWQSEAVTPHKVHPNIKIDKGAWYSWTNVTIRPGLTLGQMQRRYIAGYKRAEKAGRRKAKEPPFVTFPFASFASYSKSGYGRDSLDIFFDSKGKPRLFERQKAKFAREVLKLLYEEVTNVVPDFPNLLRLPT
jgi:hypothetical protein